MVGRDKGRPEERPMVSWKSESGIVAKASVVEKDDGERVHERHGPGDERRPLVWR